MQDFNSVLLVVVFDVHMRTACRAEESRKRMETEFDRGASK